MPSSPSSHGSSSRPGKGSAQADGQADAGAGSSGTHLADGRYAPGAVLAGRYRIVSLLGKGSMGQVFLADDLVLDEQVALKFLPIEAAENPELMQRFVTEARLARKVTHPNVARVHDIGEADGRTFLSMEYVDGEDLDKLLKRIGRLPAEKALDIGKQICEGLYAAHDRGVLHRDLKPANLMLDNRGRVCITDFGLAELVRQENDGRVMGTPAYMSPEQILGKDVDVRSDVYSLGLVLYEIFSGKRAFEGKSFGDYVRMQQKEAPRLPKSMLEQVDPGVVRTILKCVEKKPENRPASARQVTLALPGGDPLAAALASGDTPAPELVAGAGTEAAPAVHGVTKLFMAFVLLLGGLLALVPTNRSQQLVSQAEQPPAVLRDRVASLLADVGYDTPPNDYGEWYGTDAKLASAHRADGHACTGHDDPLPSPVVFHYRQSPNALQRAGLHLNFEDPAPLVPGMVAVTTDVTGRLLHFASVPGGPDENPLLAETAPVGDEQWERLFHAAGFDRDEWQAVRADFLPSMPASERRSWRSTAANTRGWRITAAGLSGLPVFFHVDPDVVPAARDESAERVAYAATRQEGPAIGSGTDNETGSANEAGRSDGETSRHRRGSLAPLEIESAPLGSTRRSNAVGWIGLSILAAGALLAFQNVRRGHSDRKGAWRLGLFGFCTHLVYWLGTADHTADVRAWAATLVPALGYCTFIGLHVYVFYLALEPFARRRWPAVLISWSRLLSGRLADPILGRDILVGGVATLASLLLVAGLDRALGAFGMGGAMATRSVAGMESWTATLGVAAKIAGDSVIISLLLLLTLMLLRSWIRISWLASTIWVAALASTMAVESHYSIYAVAASCGFMLLFLALLTRYGIVACISAFFVQGLLRTVDLTVDPRSWHLHTTVVTLAVLLALGTWAYRAALAGRPLFTTNAFSDD